MLFLQDHYCEHNSKNLEKDEGAIEKPGKDPRLAESYRPISLLSTCYKLLERLVLHCVSPKWRNCLVPDKPGSREIAALANKLQH